jgi:hypothetical protein
MTRFFALLLLLPTLAFGSVEIKGSGTSNVAKVNSGSSLQVNEGPSTRPTFYATISGATTTAAWYLTCEASAGTGFKVSKVCVTLPVGATAAGTIVTTTIRRTTAASSGGTALTSNGTGVLAVTAADGVSSYGGVCRGLGATITAGATIDQFQYRQVVLPATTAATNPYVICRDYGLNGEQPPAVPAGVNNGIAVVVSAAGAGSVAEGSATMVLIAE